MAADTGYLNAPIPGMSLTTTPGDRPWENPPSLVTIEEAMEYYASKILGNKDSHDQLLDVLELGVPVSNLASILQKNSVMNGVHTLDVGMLVLPVIEELIMAVADMNNVSYVPSPEAVAKSMSISPREARKAVEAMRKSKAEETVQEEKPRGLMAKPIETME
jgi:hypothetical protein